MLGLRRVSPEHCVCDIYILGCQPSPTSERKNLRNLVDLFTGQEEKNYARTFWRWLSRQPWRRMLPTPVERRMLV